MATHNAIVNLSINLHIGDLYVRDNYVIQNYVEGGIVASDLDLATVLPIASSTLVVTAIYAPAKANVSITATSSLTITAIRSIPVDPFNTFTLKKETRLNTITAESRVFALQNESRSFNVKPETRIYNLLKETRNFKIKRPAFVGATRKDTINV